MTKQELHNGFNIHLYPKSFVPTRKTMKRKLVITYRFNTVDIEPVSKQEIQTLEEHAMEKIFEYMSNGFTSGELACDVSEDNTVYGWFEVSKTEEN